MKEKSFFGYKAAIGAFLVIFVNLGAASTLGVFLPSMSEFTGWPVGILSYNGTVNTIGNVLLSLICVKLLSKYGPKKLMFISIIGIFLNFQLYTLATDGQNVTSLVLILLAGFSASFAIVFGTHAVCTYVISSWFVEKREKLSAWCSLVQALALPHGCLLPDRCSNIWTTVHATVFYHG